MTDLAGAAYWNDVWDAPAKPAFDPSARANRTLAGLFRCDRVCRAG